MSDDLERRLQLERDRISQLEPHQLPLLTGAEQTRLSWARAVKGRADLPPVYLPFMDDVLKAGQAFPYAVLTPTFPGFLQRENEKLVFRLADQFWVVERVKNTLHSVCYRQADVHYVELGSILLDSWLKISGSVENTLVTSRLRFNTVSDRLFTPLVDWLRPTLASRDDWSLDAERGKFDYLMDLNFKFMNYARRSLMPGETVLCPMLQPEIRAQIVSLFGHSLYRTIALAHIHILTDVEWIIIRDDEHAPAGHAHSRYGGVWAYLPLSKIEAVTLTTRDRNLLAVSIQLPLGDQLTAIFAGSNRVEIDRFFDQLRQVAPHIRIM
ncbi:MAG: hypothetical protein U0559_18410 [Anaerolineae bacterium]